MERRGAGELDDSGVRQVPSCGTHDRAASEVRGLWPAHTPTVAQKNILDDRQTTFLNETPSTRGSSVPRTFVMIQTSSANPTRKLL